MNSFDISKIYKLNHHNQLMDCSGEGCSDGDCGCDVVDGR